jgi:hypothetical protein
MVMADRMVVAYRVVVPMVVVSVVGMVAMVMPVVMAVPVPVSLCESRLGRQAPAQHCGYQGYHHKTSRRGKHG